jgi:DNA-directed RNA polymerase specialized sigma24 family protein
MSAGYWDVLVHGAFDREQPRSLDREAAQAAAVELRQRGLTAHDIAAALRISEGAVRELLREGAL